MIITLAAGSSAYKGSICPVGDHQFTAVFTVADKLVGTAKYTHSNQEYEVKHNKHIAEIALLMQERDKFKSELSPIRTELSELQLSLEQEKAEVLSAEKMWNEEKYALTAEISELNLAFQSANKQISDFTQKSEERNAKNNGFIVLFGR